MYDEQMVRVLVTAPLGVGGVTSMMINIQSHLDRNKINFDYLVTHDRKEPQEDTVLAMGSRKIVASVDKIPVRFLRTLFRPFAISKVCKQNNIKILHCNADCAIDVLNILGARLGGVKYVTIHSHNAGIQNEGIGLRMADFMLKPLIPLCCDNCYGCSDLAARALLPKSLIKKKKYSVLPNGIDLKKFDYSEQNRQEIRNELNLEGKFVVGHAGRFVTVKNHSFLLDVFSAIHEKNKDTVLLLFGVGELMDSIKEKAEALGIKGSVIFYGSTNEMYKMWQAIDVFIMPSFSEGFPVTGIEAQASGLPCIFSDTITKEVGLTDKTEFLSLNESPKTWAEHALMYMGCERKSEVAKLRKAGYDIQQTADTLSKLYLEVYEKKIRK